MASLSDYAVAAQMRDVVNTLVQTTIERVRPKYRYGTVTEIDRAARVCWVLYPGEPAAVRVAMGSIQPYEVGQVVRVDGVMGDRFVSDVMGRSYPPWDAPWGSQAVPVYDISTASFAVLTPDLASITPPEDLMEGRLYRVLFAISLCVSVANTVVSFPLQQRFEGGAYATMRTFRSTPATAYALTSDVCTGFWDFDPASLDGTGAYDFKIVGLRHTGTGTVEVTAVSMSVDDLGPA